MAHMTAFLHGQPTAGACGAHLHYGDGRFQHGAFRFPTLAQVVLDLWPVYRLPGGHRLYDSFLNGRYPHRLWQGEKPFPVDFTLGAALMLRREAVQTVGGLDEGFFMYCEEMDWCLRLWQTQWPVYAVPQAHITHYEGQSSRQTPWTAQVQLWRSRLRFFHKHRQRYTLTFVLALRLILRLYLAARRRDAQDRFDRGETDGVATAAELAAYTEIGRLLANSTTKSDPW